MKNIIDVLTELSQLDFDAVCAYEQALKQIDDKNIYQKISEFRQDHLRHIEDLNRLISKHNGTPPERSKDFKGFLIEGFTAIRSMTGTLGALKAMQGNEKTTNKNYKQALEDNPDLPDEVISILEKNYKDEQRHLRYIEEELEQLSEAQ